MLPEKISVQTGALFQNYTIIGIGEIKLPYGNELDGVSWNARLPGRVRRNEPYVRAWRSPQELINLLNSHKTQGKKLRLMVTETAINLDVNIQNFSGDYSGGYGDYLYNISFSQAKDLKVTVSEAPPLIITPPVVNRPQISQSVQIIPAPPQPPPPPPPPLQNTPPQPRTEDPPPKTHTVVSGDNLWRIAQKHLGAGIKWGQIYEANKDAIEAEAIRRGRKSSDNGHWIWPGTVLIIP
jgi:hypothetical protein